MDIIEAFNMVKPLSQEHKSDMLKIAIDLAKPGTLIIQDEECPSCLNCGARLNLKGVCQRGCGRVKVEPRARMY